MKVRGPLVTLAAVAALGVGILILNISQEPEPASPGKPVAASTATTAPATAGCVIPIVGGLLFFGLVYVWLTSALWFFQTNGITF